MASSLELNTSGKKIIPFLWFASNAEEAVNFYTGLFPDSFIRSSHRYHESHPDLAGKIMSIEFELMGQKIAVINGGPMYTLSPAFSLAVNCDTQEEVDHYWNALTEGGEPLMCGWVTDRFGLTWQIIPSTLISMMTDPDTEKSGRVIQAMMQMRKLSIPELEKAYKGI